MRIAFDATALLGPRTGVGVFTAEVLERLATRPDLDVVAYAVTWRGRHALATVAPSGVQVLRRPMPARPLRRAWSRGNLPPIEWWTGSVDVVHGPNFVVPPTHGAAVVTVHDLTCIRFPELCTPDTLEYPRLIRRAVARGATVHVVSQFVGDEVQAAFGIDADRVVVVPNGLRPPGAERRATDAAAGVAAAGGERYLLAVGTVEPRKDLPLLVRAFDQLAATDGDLRLVLAGPDGWGVEALRSAIAASPHRDRIVRLGWVSDDRRLALVRGARALVFPSIYEGFGLPPLEAMSVGTPVVATRAGSLPEVLGDGALLVPVGDQQALAGAIHSVLTDPELVEDLTRRGAARVSQYSWEATTDALVELYRQVGSNPR